MVKKCKECGDKIEEDSLGKIKGTVVKKLVGEKNELEYMCSECQKNLINKIILRVFLFLLRILSYLLV